MSEQACVKRRRQIFTEQAGVDFRPDRQPHEDTHPDDNVWIPDDAWVKNVVGRLTEMVRSIGGRH